MRWRAPGEATRLIERCKVPEEALDVRVLAQGLLDTSQALTTRIGIACQEPPVGQSSDASVALAEQVDGLVGAQERRGLARRFEVLQLLAILDP